MIRIKKSIYYVSILFFLLAIYFFVNIKPNHITNDKPIKKAGSSSLYSRQQINEIHVVIPSTIQIDALDKSNTITMNEDILEKLRKDNIVTIQNVETPVTYSKESRNFLLSILKKMNVHTIHAYTVENDSQQSSSSLPIRYGNEWAPFVFSPNESHDIQYVRKNNISIALIAHAIQTDEKLQSDPYGMRPKKNHEKILSQKIQVAEQQADVVAVFLSGPMHNASFPSYTQLHWARFLANEGVDIVVDTTNETIQPPATIHGKNNNETFVIYGMGSLFSQRMDLVHQISAIFSVNIVKHTYNNGETNIILRNQVVDLTFSSSNKKADYKVELLKNAKHTLQQDEMNFDYIYLESTRKMNMYMPLLIQ